VDLDNARFFKLVLVDVQHFGGDFSQFTTGHLSVPFCVLSRHANRLAISSP
jgi:hypothetical protein